MSTRPPTPVSIEHALRGCIRCFSTRRSLWMLSQRRWRLSYKSEKLGSVGNLRASAPKVSPIKCAVSQKSAVWTKDSQKYTPVPIKCAVCHCRICHYKQSFWILMVDSWENAVQRADSLTAHFIGETSEYDGLSKARESECADTQTANSISGKYKQWSTGANLPGPKLLLPEPKLLPDNEAHISAGAPV